jgi:bacteriorhodopsin
VPACACPFLPSPPAARSRTLDVRTQTILRLAGPFAMALWVAFPLVWCLREFGAIDDSGEGYAFPALDVIAKIAFSVVMVTGDFSRLDAEIEAELKVIDQGECRDAGVNR